MISRFEKLLLAAVSTSVVFSVHATALTATISTPPPAATGYFKLGTTKNPAGHEISVNSRCVLFDGQSVFPVMGEMHYSRVPSAEWRDELLKMKAGGVDIVATYVFWIHHEEIQGEWDWSGQRDLKKFVQTCGELGLKVIVRCGPWCHGEVRNGGLPDWVQARKDWKLRSTDTNFLAATKILYGEITKQLQGELWKDGGPVIGIQVDNEFGGSPNYLMALKKMAIEAGLDVPFYIKTGWPAMKTPVPLGELLPLFGAYPDGFWARSLKPMDGNDWENFTFKLTRTDTGVGNDTLKVEKNGDTSGTEKYPHLTCEVGGGMPASYHRRINYDPRDIESVVLTQLGGGSSLLGYYMYHGGQNPEGKLSTLQESTATSYANDLPVKSYDFNAPLGEFGQINPQYYWLRRLHLFLHDFGAPLAQMPATLPDLRVTNKNDFTTLRWAARSDGNSGYVFVNNYQRLQPLPEKRDVQFKLNLPGGELIFPQKPVTIPADAFFFWPFNMDLNGTKLIYATAQPVCVVEEFPGEYVYFFVKQAGVDAEFIFAKGTATIWMRHGSLGGALTGCVKISQITPSMEPFAEISNSVPVKIVLLDETNSRHLFREKWQGATRLFYSPDNIVVDGDTLKISKSRQTDSLIRIMPCPESFRDGNIYRGRGHDYTDGRFGRLILPADTNVVSEVRLVNIQAIKPAGPPREIPLTTGKSHLAIAPTDADFTNAAVWKIILPASIEQGADTPATKKIVARDDTPLLRIRYVGDVARLTLNGKLIADNFYAGREFDLGLQRYAPEIFTGDLRLEILPLRKDAPIFIEPKDRPDFGTNETVLNLQSVELVH